jgi:tetratricopeptide (TPR) repeat protein
MKKYFNQLAIVAFGTLCLTATSCSDFLTEEPESNYTADNFYQTQADFEYALNGVYDALQSLYDGDDVNDAQYGLLRFFIVRSDDHNSYSTNLYDGGAGTFSDDATCKPLDRNWQKLYVLITRSNEILSRIDNVQFDDETVKDQIKGECYAMRGFAYHTLGVMFGGVPLMVDHVYTVDEAKEVGRSTQDETFDQAIADYTKAMDLLPAQWGSTKTGCVTKYAAEAMMGRLYMYRHNYQAAANAFEDVINSGVYSLATNYIDCVSQEGNNNSERVWEVQYISGLVGEGQYFSEETLPEYYTGYWGLSGSSAGMRVSTNLLNDFEDGDLRKDIITADSMLVRGVLDDYTWFIKYNHYSVKPTKTNDWGINLPIIRYTDVCMMYAEALNEINGAPTEEAISYINKVRERAGLADLTAEQTASKDAFLKVIKHERRIEFAYEGLRWVDLVRWGDMVSVMKAFFADADEGNGIFSKNVAEYRQIFPIPQEEITRYANTDKMWQNPNY